MRTIIGTLAGLVGLASVSVQPLLCRPPRCPQPNATAPRRSSWCVTAAATVGIATTGATSGAIGIGATAFPTGTPTGDGAPAGTILTQIGAVPARGVGVIHNNRDARRTFARRRLCGAVG